MAYQRSNICYKQSSRLKTDRLHKEPLQENEWNELHLLRFAFTTSLSLLSLRSSTSNMSTFQVMLAGAKQTHDRSTVLVPVKQAEDMIQQYLRTKHLVQPVIIANVRSQDLQSHAMSCAPLDLPLTIFAVLAPN